MVHGGLRPCNNNTQKKEKREDDEEEKEDGDEEVRKNPLVLPTLNLSVMLWILTCIKTFVE
jgi:hypothetical protein